MNKPAPFTKRQFEYLQRCLSSWFNVAEGGKRGGKNVLQTMAFCIALENHPNRLHLVSGVSTATARLNILDCDGFGMLNYFEHRCRTGQYQNRDCLYVIDRHGKEKIILISGGGKNGDEKLIKGNTYGMAYITEANECSQTFIQEVFDRTLSSKDRKIFHDLNPKSEGHWYYEDVLNFHEMKQKRDTTYGYNYGHFTIADNMSVSTEEMNQRIATYDKTSVWYLRDIKGERKQTEGLVYPMFNPFIHVCKTEERAYTRYVVSCDYGTVHPCIFHLYGLYEGVWYLAKEYHYDGSKQPQKTVEQYHNDLLGFVGSREIEIIYLDNAPIAASFNIYLIQQGVFRYAKVANDVSKGIQSVASVLSKVELRINDCCKNTIREFGLYSWNAKSTEDKPIKENDDNMDCLRYFVQSCLAKPKKESWF